MKPESPTPAAPIMNPERELPAEDGPEEAAETPAELLRKITQERDALAEARDALNDRWLRAVADSDNVRKRAQREIAEARQHAIAETVRPFLAVLDGLDRAAEHAGASADDLLKGIQMLQRQSLEAIRRAGLEPVEALHQPFDPHLHEAIEMVGGADAAPGSVVEQLQRGYKLKDKLIRPAMVKVAQARD